MFYLARNYGIKLVPDKEADGFAAWYNRALNKTQVCDTANALIPEGGEGFYVNLMTLKSFGKLPDPRPKIKNVMIRVLIMKAQCDNQKWGYTAEYLEIFKNSELKVIPDAGHNIFIEQPDVYVRTIREFLMK